MRRILFLTAHRPGRSPGQRFRFEQYLGALQENGFQCDISFLLNEADDISFYSKRKYFRKFIIFLKSIRIRLSDLKKVVNYDLVFIYREAVMFGSCFFEKRIYKKGIPIILDFDDAIWLMDVSEGNRNLKWLKRPSKTRDIIALSTLAIAGNNYLADYARRYSKKVVVIPTTIDSDQCIGSLKLNTNKPLCIGWTGSSTTLKHFELAIPILTRLKQKYQDHICFSIIADKEHDNKSIDFTFIKWNRETEISDLGSFDIGIMPLPDDEWSKGKCGFKGLQYMALEIPTIMSPVGVNPEIIKDGENGFLASSEEEWIEKLSLLIESEELRLKLGRAGRQTVIERYSFKSQKNRYLELFNQMLDKNQ